MKIIFDFDHTLFSARKLYFEIKKVFAKLGVDEELFKETFEESKGKGRDYKPKRQFELICEKKPQIEIKTLERSFEKILRRVPKFLYQDTIRFLKKWRNKADLILLSYGEEEFQREKIKKSKITPYFRNIFITRDINKTSPLREFLKNNKKTIFVEDNPRALFEIKKAFPNIITVRINRGEGKYTLDPDNSKIDFSIKNLKELEKILSEKF